MRLVGEKVILRDVTPADHVDMSRWQNDSDVVQFDPAVGSPVIFVWLSIDTVSGIHIGQCSMYDLADFTHILKDVQLGIRIGEKSYWNLGYGTETVQLLTKFGFEAMNISRIWVKVLPENVGAVRCYEKCGFKRSTLLHLDGYSFVVMEVWKP